MTHPLAVYTVIYVAILFVTVSIWGGDIGDAGGDLRLTLCSLAVFSLKLAIDDYLHFQQARSGQLHRSLSLSLLIYLLLAGSIASAARGLGGASAWLFAGVFLVGIVWLRLEGLEGLEGPEKQKRIGWVVVNIAYIGLLVWAALVGPQATYSSASLPLSVLFVLIVADFFYFGTLRRLAETGSATSPDPVGSAAAADASAARAAAAANRAETAAAQAGKTLSEIRALSAKEVPTTPPRTGSS